jgi:hypothetical protein
VRDERVLIEAEKRKLPIKALSRNERIVEGWE